MKRTLLPILISVFLLTSNMSGAFAQQKVRLPQEYEEVKTGFFTRVLVGIGQGNVTFKNADNDRELFEFTGYTIPLGVQFGSRITKNLGIYGNLKGYLFPKPEMVNYTTYSISADEVVISTFGGGLAFYFGKGNSYFSPAVLYSFTSSQTGSESGMTKGGLGLDLTLGSDKYISEKMAFGFAFVLHISSMTDQKSTQFGEPKVSNIFYGFEMSLKFGK